MVVITDLSQVEPVDILAIGVHPDDVELSCSGTLLKHIDLGYTVGLCDLTKGQLGTRGTEETRMEEAAESAAIMGALWRFNTEFEDGFFVHDELHIRKIVGIIRAAKPKIVLANALSDRHPDHGRAAKLVADACFFSGLAKVETYVNDESQSPHRPQQVYHYIQDQEREADFVVDITDHFDKKLACILAYKTQFFNGDTEGPQTPISSKQFMEFMKSKNRVYGRDIKVDFAEAFNVTRKPGVTDLFHLT